MRHTVIMTSVMKCVVSSMSQITARPARHSRLAKAGQASGVCALLRAVQARHRTRPCAEPHAGVKQSIVSAP